MPVAIYARISSAREGETSKTARQIDLCHAELEKRKLVLYENDSDDAELGGYRGAFADENISAYTRKHRPAWAAVEKLALTGKIDGILAYASDRIHRRTVEMMSFIGAVNDAGHGLTLYFVRGADQDFSSVQGRMVAGVLSVFAGAEVEQLTQRVVDQKAEAAEEGRWNGGRPPLGYQVVPVAGGKLGLEPHPTVAPALVDVINGYLAGKSLVTALSEFRQETGMSTGYTSLKYSLCSPSIAGQRMHFPQSKRRGRSVHELYTTPYLLENEAVLYPANWAPIISLRQWRLLRDKLVNQSSRKRGKRPSKSLLAGLLRCANCGGSLGYDGVAYTVPGDEHSGIKRYATYRCAKSNNGCGRMQIGARLLESFIEAESRKILERAVRGKGFQSTKVDAQRAMEIETELQNVEDSLLQAYRDRNKGDVGEAVYRRFRMEQEARRNDLEVEMSQLRLDGATNAQLVSGVEMYDSLDVNQRRGVLSKFIVEIEVRSVQQLGGARNVLNPRRVMVTWSINSREMQTFGDWDRMERPTLRSQKPHDW